MEIRIRHALAVGTLTIALPAAAQESVRSPDWQALTKPGFVTYFWDRASTVRRGDVVQVMVRAKANIVSAGPGHGDWLTEISCADRRWRIVRTINYGRNNEAIVEATPKVRFRKIKPGYHEALRAAVCPAQGADVPSQGSR